MLDDIPSLIEAGNAAPGNDLTELGEFVRAGLKRQISGKCSRETNTIATYLLDPGIEGLLSRRGSLESDAQVSSSLDKGQQDKILESIRQEVARLPPRAQLPLILTTRDGHFKSREVEVSMTVFGRAIVLPRVPQGVCPTCASRVYKAEVLECVESVMREGSVSHSR